MQFCVLYVRLTNVAAGRISNLAGHDLDKLAVIMLQIRPHVVPATSFQVNIR